MNKSLLLTFALSSLAGSALAAPPVATPAPGNFDALFKQADFWQGKQRQDLAKDALRRVLAADPNNTEALYRLAMIAVQEGNKVEAQQYSDKLKAVSPNDSHLEDIRIAEASTHMDSGALNEARVMAASGQSEEAIKRYKTLFSGDTPPATLAVEYYQTLAGTKTGWDDARKGLEKLHQQQPGNTRIAVAYGEVLSYHQQTRRQAIALLKQYDGKDLEATKGWRQALLWLDATKADKPLYEAYEKAHPGDESVPSYYKKATTLTPAQQASQSRANGYQALNAGKLASAYSAFEQALSYNSKDAEARAGLGLVELKRQQFASARRNLGLAMAQAPAERHKWQKAYNSADFYASLTEARKLADSRQYDQAMTLVEPLTDASGSQARDAQLLKADILQKQGKLDASAHLYQQLLDNNAKDIPARVGLVNVLRQQQRWNDANQVANALPKSARKQLGDMASGQAMLLREKAKLEPPVMAEATLREAMKLAPKNPWVRLDLARLLNKTSRPLAAQVVVNKGVEDYGTANDRYVAALLAKDQARWGDVSHLLGEVKPQDRTPQIDSLAEEAALQARLDEIKRRQSVGDRDGARKLIMDLYNQPPKSAAGVGEVASLLYDSGEPAMAVMLIRQNDKRKTTEPVGDYQTQIVTLVKAGDDEDANDLLAKLSQRQDLTPADWKAIEQTRNTMAVVKADKLRKSEKLADAYDVLAARLRVAPNDESLLLAMARLYQSGNKNKKSLQIYQYTLKHNPDSTSALEGGVMTALALKDFDTADDLMAQLSTEKAEQPEMLLLAAKVARAEGDNDTAVALLAKARGKLFKNQPQQPWLQASDSQPGYANPFADQNGAKKGADNPFRRPSFLPGGDDPSKESSPWYQASKDSNAQPSLVAQIDALSEKIQRDSATTYSSEVQFRSRDGESGLSKLDEVKTPLTLNTQALGGRVKFAVTPTYLNGGALTSGFSRFGAGAISDGASSLSSSLDDLDDVLDSIQDTAYDYQSAEQEYEDAYAIYEASLTDSDTTAIEQAQYLANANEAELAAEEAQTTFEEAASQDLLKAIGLDTSTLTSSQQTQLDNYLTKYFGSSDLSLDSSSLSAFQTSMSTLQSEVATLKSRLNSIAALSKNPPAQHDAGVGLSLAYNWENLGFDIGTTPLGFERVNLIGGIDWQPQLDDNLQLQLNLARRPVTDSVLSYAGTTDPVTGETWGAVTKNGLKAGLAYDDGDVGLYGSLGGYLYTGTRVANNTSLNLSVGGYLRPINEKNRQLQAGVNVTFEGYDKNMSNFSLGHGGYFSPQDYVAVAFPVSYSEKHDNFNYTLKVAPGFQSYTENAVDYFPDDDNLQSLLELMTALGITDASAYPANSKSGFGLSFDAEGQYHFSPSVTLGGKLAFDNFGDYNESTVLLYLHYLMGVKND
ncbi:cellulose synthase subunit BcsC-related outer membrane protein [Gallaecimonas mangrovi]|uniref:cellulose synthase subunit BcsC-related outer membrane protein n=1 Tax=Gallaecimonas mangrovi TaxID=2291597 RepID=UPI001866D361|nr:cellulose synthase subunit BcsC-related outer membrane protein [Gallaecimonas mangrovi]